jgi:hypothetical protein
VTREEVYKIIDGEREYQNHLGSTRTDGLPHSVGDYIVMLDRYIRRAVDGWTDHAGTAYALHEIRKIAGIAVHCMEDHDTPRREQK